MIDTALTMTFGLRLPGPPLSQKSALMTLLDAGVNVAIGVVNESTARNTRFEIAWVKTSSAIFGLSHSANTFIGCARVQWDHQQTAGHSACVNKSAQGTGSQATTLLCSGFSALPGRERVGFRQQTCRGNLCGVWKC